MATYKHHVSFLVPMLRPANYAHLAIYEISVVSLEIAEHNFAEKGYYVLKKTMRKIYNDVFWCCLRGFKCLKHSILILKGNRINK